MEVAVGGRAAAAAGACGWCGATEDERRAGFGYGTLPGHAMAGEESFVVDIDGTGAVWLTITSFSRPTTAVARLAGPFAPVFQRLYARTCGIVLRGLVKRGHARH
ncbi:DUF1990 family protein [Actinomadura sp. CNU-125]|uniref:DUF1990 family protein n=1 Tax=Actinomadura sp. CNU-125 TaxID=1904961 RepID=UPI003967A73E